ncbi:MAG: glycosyltransferase [Cytophagales bacterium]|nr:MAG: glycosyltransferase [Cytophagales bacterium]TAF59757.1 MAG: glycosyltransferase [Cytophagales bacterium]
MSKILIVCPYPRGIAPGQRFRFEQYLDALQENGHDIVYKAFLSLSAYHLLYQKGRTLAKIAVVLLGYIRRVWHLAAALRADYVFVYREATPLGFPMFEFVVAKIFRKKLIYDFDDAIWIPATSAQNRLAAWLKSPQKVQKNCRWAYRLSLGNAYLCRNAATFRAETWSENQQTTVRLNPTTIDTENMHNQLHPQTQENLVVGWTGSHSTLVYLENIWPLIAKLQQIEPFTFLVICNEDPKPQLPYYQFIKWNTEQEIPDLLRMHIGIMPLHADAWSEGKCGFKALQYMALGIPAVVSPVGVNKDIVQNGENGFLCKSEAEWQEALLLLLRSAAKRQLMGQKARETVLQKYSVKANTPNVLELFKA